MRLLPLEIAGEQYALFSFPLPEPVCPPELTLAEQEVLKAVVQGASNDEIARSRGVSTNTIANQLRSIYTKLGVASRRELAALCMRAVRPP
jgi:DNA-binding CsgD family transcriptional regulator